MKKLSISETIERKEKLDLAKLFVQHVEIGNIELYEYSNEQEKKELLSRDWVYHSPMDTTVGLRINGAKLTNL
jgi:hypothetical protein